MPSSELENWMWLQALKMIHKQGGLQRLEIEYTRHSVLVSFEPPVNIFETLDHLIIMIALPGIMPSHINVTLEGEVLMISARRFIPSMPEHATIHRLEIPCGHLQRRVILPTGYVHIDKQEYSHGCLAIHLRKDQ